MQKRDSETRHKGFRDFEIGRKFAETKDFQRPFRHPFKSLQNYNQPQQMPNATTNATLATNATFQLQ